MIKLAVLQTDDIISMFEASSKMPLEYKRRKHGRSRAVEPQKVLWSVVGNEGEIVWDDCTTHGRSIEQYSEHEGPFCEHFFEHHHQIDARTGSTADDFGGQIPLHLQRARRAAAPRMHGGYRLLPKTFH